MTRTLGRGTVRIVLTAWWATLAITAVGCSSDDAAERDIPEPVDSTIAPGEKADAEAAATTDQGSDEASQAQAQAPEADEASAPLPETVDSQEGGDNTPAPAALTDAAPAQAPVSVPAAVPVAAAPAPVSRAATAAAVAAEAAPPAPAAGPYRYTDGTGTKMWAFEDHVNVYAAPSRDAQVVSVVEYGEPVGVLSRKHGWAKLGEGQFVRLKSLTDRKHHFYWRKKPTMQPASGGDQQIPSTIPVAH